MTCTHGLDTEIVDCAQCEREQREKRPTDAEIMQLCAKHGFGGNLRSTHGPKLLRIVREAIATHAAAPQRPLSSDCGESTVQSVTCPTDKEK